MAVDEDPGHAEALVERGGDRVVGVVDLDDEDRASGHFDALGHPVEGGQSRDVADEEVPIGVGVEHDLAARPDDVDVSRRAGR